MNIENNINETKNVLKKLQEVRKIKLELQKSTPDLNGAISFLNNSNDKTNPEKLLKLIEKWAKHHQKILDPQITHKEFSKNIIGGFGECTVIKKGDIVKKLTDGDDFELGNIGHSKDILEFLKNLEAHNKLFKAETKLEGIVFLRNTLPRIVTSQPYHGDKHADEKKIEKFFKDDGYDKHPDGGWTKTTQKKEKIFIIDAVPENILENEKGELKPIDLQIQIQIQKKL